jgi:tetratricopeptide (TPR) repeat protein
VRRLPQYLLLGLLVLQSGCTTANNFVDSLNHDVDRVGNFFKNNKAFQADTYTDKQAYLNLLKHLRIDKYLTIEKYLKEMAPPRDESATADPVRARLSRAEYYAGEGHAPEAVMELRTAASLMGPLDLRMIEQSELLGMVYLSANEPVEAQDAFIAAIKTAHDLGVHNTFVADSYIGIGFSLAARGRYNRASQYLHRGLDLGPDPALGPRAVKYFQASTARVGEDPELDRFGAPLQVRRIVIKAEKTSEAVLRERVPFKEGDVIDSRDLARTKEAFFRMNAFKRVDISTAEFEGATEVDITLKDGRYIIPFPVIAAGAGGSRGGAIVQERNMFGQAEEIDLAGINGPNGQRFALAGDEEGWTGRISMEKRTYTERLYSDGGYSAVYGISEPADQSDVARFVAVADSYGKTTQDVVLSVQRKITSSWAAEAGLDHATVAYNTPNPAVPGDTGKEGNLYVDVKYGAVDYQAANLGAILGYGLADIDDRIKPLRRPMWSSSAEAKLTSAGRATASAVFYTEGQARWRTSYLWRDHSSLSLSVAGAHGAGLPSNEMIATGRLTALQGYYAREFRGETAGGLSLDYSRRLHAGRWGVWQAGVFAEDGRAWFTGNVKDKQGLGVSMFYRFWRFPLPLGLSYTYSIDDKDGLISAAVGGRF